MTLRRGGGGDTALPTLLGSNSPSWPLPLPPGPGGPEGGAGGRCSGVTAMRKCLQLPVMPPFYKSGGWEGHVSMSPGQMSLSENE